MVLRERRRRRRRRNWWWWNFGDDTLYILVEGRITSTAPVVSTEFTRGRCQRSHLISDLDSEVGGVLREPCRSPCCFGVEPSPLRWMLPVLKDQGISL